MNEKEKIQEAKYFYSVMVKEQEDRLVFKFHLSGFLSAARSVMQYALEEAKKRQGGQKWYDDWMASSSVLSFFKDKRDFNIHTAPIDPRKNVKLKIKEALHISESVHIVLRDKNGKVKETRDIKEEPKPRKEAKPSVESESRYEFEDWPGKESLISLCEKYIQKLEKVMEDGIKKGFISG
jgi:hypothetical protein